MKKRPLILSASFVKSVREAGRYGDGRGSHGLSLLVKSMKNGRISKSWSQRLIVNGKPTMIGIGSYPLISLAEAREVCLENKKALLKGVDPRAGIPTFREATESVIRLHSEGWKDSGKSEIHWRASLRDYAFPTLASKRVDQINTADLMATLTPYWQNKHATMKKILQRYSIIMRWCIAQGYRDNDPTIALAYALPKNGRHTQHLKSLHHSKVGAALAKIRQFDIYPTIKLCFEFLTLTAVRSKEARGAVWSEINCKNRVWIIPASRMKTGKEHKVPLSDNAMALLDQARQYADTSGLIFPSIRGKVIVDSIFSGVTRENGIQGTAHGMRSSFRSWCSDTGVNREIAEMCLAHVVQGVEGAYQRSDLLQARAEVMEAWGRYITS